MTRVLSYLLTFAAGVLLALLASVSLRPVQAADVPTPPSTVQPTATRTPTSTPTPTQIPSATATAAPQPVVGLGWAGQVQCYNCSPLKIKVRLSHYNPNQFDLMYPQLNCWNYDEAHKYCLSPTWIGVPWETGWGLFSACSVDWPVGAWVEVPGAITTICMDHGADVVCQDGICQVDVLGPGGAEWDGKVFEATLWVPKSWMIRFTESQKEDE